MKWICSQIGAREHYAIPRALAKMGNLDCFYTDFWCPPRSIMRILSNSLKGRYHRELPLAKIQNFNLKSLWQEFKRREIHNQYLGFVKYGRWFSIQTRESIRRINHITPDTLFFSYDTGFLETAEYVKSNGGKCVVCQIDPGKTGQRILKNECDLWPDWSESDEVPSEYNTRRQSEWDLADIIIVNSEWSKNALIEQGVSNKKLKVIPLCYELSQHINLQKQVDEKVMNRPLTVLWLGSVNLQKGIQYLIQAAQMLKGENIVFDIVGPIGITAKAINSAPDNMIFHGRCMRDQTKKWYANADVFILPTLSDGFAITQLEAMAHGLPVITTRCCGKVVTEGEDGFIVPERDSKALADLIFHISRNRHVLPSLSHATHNKARQYGMAQLIGNLSKIESLFE